MTPTIITALHRPEDAENAFANAKRQGTHCRFIVVENGAAIGACKERGLRPDILLYSEPHQSHAKNEALKFLRRMCSDRTFWLTFDADDYYSPGYVRKMLASAHLGDVVSQSSAFVHYSSGRLVLYGSRDPSVRLGAFGSTICGWSDCVDFRVPERSWEDDTCFLSDMKKAGARFCNVGPEQHIYRRHRGNIWQMSDERADALFQLRSGGVGEEFGTVSSLEAQAIVQSPSLLGPLLKPMSFESQRAALFP